MPRRGTDIGALAHSRLGGTGQRLCLEQHAILLQHAQRQTVAPLTLMVSSRRNLFQYAMLGLLLGQGKQAPESPPGGAETASPF